MDIVEFFELSSGKWMSQRSRHDLVSKQSEAGKSDLVIEMLDKADAAVVTLCEQYSLDPGTALCGVRVTWNGGAELAKEKQTGTTVLVPIADPTKQNEGQLLQGDGVAPKAPVVGRYTLGNDQVLTLIIEDENTLYAEERLWFASPNLRLRTSLLKHPDGYRMASFCSEIRMGGAK